MDPPSHPPGRRGNAVRLRVGEGKGVQRAGRGEAPHPPDPLLPSPLPPTGRRGRGTAPQGRALLSLGFQPQAGGAGGGYGLARIPPLYEPAPADEAAGALKTPAAVGQGPPRNSIRKELRNEKPQITRLRPGTVVPGLERRPRHGRHDL